MTKKRIKSSRPRFGVLSAWFGGDYQSGLISGIESEAKLNDVEVFYFIGRPLDSPNQYENNYNVVYDAALDASLDGLVVMPMLASFSTAKRMSGFISGFAPVPLVTINFKTSYGNAILANNAAGFRALLRHLTEDHGYRKLAFLNGPEKNFDAIERAGIFASVLESRGISIDSALFTSGNFSYLSGKEAVCTFLDERGLVPGRDIEVIVCANDQMAWGAFNELESRGLRVPRDIAITGFDDIRSSIFPMPAITTVSQHVVTIGRTAVSSLLAYEPGRKDIVFDTEPVIRGSCGCGGDEASGRKKTTRPAVSGEGEPGSGRPDTSESVAGPHGHRNDMVVLLYKIIAIQDTLKLLINTGELGDWLGRHLPDLGMESGYLFLYSGLPLQSRFVRFVGGYDRQERRKGDPQSVFSLNSVFDDVLSGAERRSYCILPLLFENEQYGLLAVEVNTDFSIVYDTLNSPIGNSIRSALLMEEVSSMNRKLEEANEQKTRFFINVAHETKTPLTLIRNYLDLCMARLGSDPDLAVVKRNIDILLENMLNLLDAERLEKGALAFSHDTCVDLSESVKRKSELFRAVAEKKGMTVELRVEDKVAIRIDPWALDRILNNLLDNAVRYTQSGGKVIIDVKKEEGKAMLRVADNGPGLSDDTIAHLFEPYYQLSGKRSSKQGIGVGLSIVKKIVDDLGASVDVANGTDGGASFTVAFADAGEPADPTLLREIPLSEPSSGIIQEVDISDEAFSPDKASVLIVDDNVQMLYFLKASLGKKYNVFLATDVQAALAKLGEIERPELIVSDIMMDGLDGHALLATLNGRDEYCDIPFIFLSAASAKDEELRGLGEGAIDYIRKPFSIAELEKKIESITALRARMKKREIMEIRKGIDGLLSRIEGARSLKRETTFDSLCVEYGMSNREKEIVTLLLEGLLNKEIAFRLHLSLRAVEYHITNIFKKLGISKKYDLIAKFKT